MPRMDSTAEWMRRWELTHHPGSSGSASEPEENGDAYPARLLSEPTPIREKKSKSPAAASEQDGEEEVVAGPSTTAKRNDGDNSGDDDEDEDDDDEEVSVALAVAYDQCSNKNQLRGRESHQA